MPWCGDTRRTLGEREGPATTTWWPRSPWWPLKLWPPPARASGDEAVAIVKTLTTTTRNFFIFQPPIPRVAGWKMTRSNHTPERPELVWQYILIRQSAVGVGGQRRASRRTVPGRTFGRGHHPLGPDRPARAHRNRFWSSHFAWRRLAFSRASRPPGSFWQLWGLRQP